MPKKKHKAAKDPVPVERKFLAALSGSSIVGVLLAIAVGIQGGVVDVTWLPTWAQSLIGFLVAVLFVAAPTFQAAHTSRPELRPATQSADGEAAVITDIDPQPEPFDQSNARPIAVYPPYNQGGDWATAVAAKRNDSGADVLVVSEPGPH